MKRYYLDYAAATPLDERVFAAMEPYLKEQFYNPSSAYQAARSVKADIDSAKHRLAMVIGAKPSEIIVTAGATESVNLAIHGVVRQYGGHVVSTVIEHPAVLRAAERYPHSFVGANLKGLVAPEDIKSAITDETILVSVGYANSELGTVQPLRDIADLVTSVRIDRLSRGIDMPLYFHTDASQAAGQLDVSVSRLGVDMMTLNAGKCYGPKQVGLLWMRPEIMITPLIDGGGQERGLRSGTENVAGIIGFAEALTLANEWRKEEVNRLQKLRNELQRHLQEALPDLIINGHPKRRLPSHLHVSLPGLDGERALFALDQRGVMVATGSACAANKGTRSHILSAVGMEPDLADASLRFSLGRDTDEAAIDEIGAIVIEALKTERGR